MTSMCCDAACASDVEHCQSRIYVSPRVGWKIGARILKVVDTMFGRFQACACALFDLNMTKVIARV